MDLSSLLTTSVDSDFKGYPPEAAPTPLSDLGTRGWNLFKGDLGSPVAVLRNEMMEANAHWMRLFLDHTGASLCPHGKTTMAPQLFLRQMKDGAWGITLATPHQAKVAFSHGVQRVLLANELVSPGGIRALSTLVEADPQRELIVFADNLEVVQDLDQAWQASKPLSVLVETGIPGGRCGARNLDVALQIARCIRQSRRLSLRGVACYEGIVVTKDAASDRATVESWLKDLVTLAQRCDSDELFESEECLLSAGGTAYFDLVANILGRAELRHPSRVLLRSGCYLTHDAGHYQRLVNLLEGRLDLAWRPEGHLQPALEIWTQVLSRPEPGLVFLDAGKRDLPHDLGLPQPSRMVQKKHQPYPRACPNSWRITALHDQHARLELPEDTDLEVGDLLGLSVSHPCTTFDKWRLVFVVDEQGRVIEGLKTFF